MTQPHVVSAAIYTRCCHRFAASGRQCRLLTSDASSLCAQHFAKKKAAAQNADFANLLFSRSDGFQTAQGINHSLAHLYELLARDRISVRRAQTLAYISSLLLRTLPAIDQDRQSGFSDAFNAKLESASSASATPSAATPSTIADPPSPDPPTPIPRDVRC